MIDHLTDFPHDRRAKQEISGATTQTQANFDALKSHSQSTAGNVSNEAGNTVKQIRTAAEEAADTAAVSYNHEFSEFVNAHKSILEILPQGSE